MEYDKERRKGERTEKTYGPRSPNDRFRKTSEVLDTTSDTPTPIQEPLVTVGRESFVRNSWEQSTNQNFFFIFLTFVLIKKITKRKYKRKGGQDMVRWCLSFKIPFY